MKKRLLIITIIVEIVLIIATIIIYNPFLKLKINGNATIKISVGEKYTDAGAKASYFKENLTENIKVKSDVDVNKIGEYHVTYTVTRKRTTKEKTRTVIVADLISPEITLKGNSTVSLCGKEYTEEGYTATDNVDGDLTEHVKVTKEKDKIIYYVSDKSGNKKEVIRYLVNDKEKPTVNLINSDILTFEENSTYREFGAKAVDNCDGDITTKIDIISNVDTSKHETFTVTYKVKDNSGNEASITRKVKIYTQEDWNKGYEESIAGPTYIKGILIVNKKYSLPKNFKTDNTEALKALENLKADAKKAGHSLPTKSGYRDYSFQEALYNKYLKQKGKAYADASAARPGYSEHQTGLAFDIGLGSQQLGILPEGIWLRENCAKYGFIIRYPQYKEGITGYKYEPWHVRYVGVEAATEIMEKNITLEEYLGIYDINDWYGWCNCSRAFSWYL